MSFFHSMASKMGSAWHLAGDLRVRVQILTPLATFVPGLLQNKQKMIPSQDSKVSVIIDFARRSN